MVSRWLRDQSGLKLLPLYEYLLTVLQSYESIGTITRLTSSNQTFCAPNIYKRSQKRSLHYSYTRT